MGLALPLRFCRPDTAHACLSDAPEQAEKLRRIFSRHLSNIDFVVVSDITVTGCFDEAIQDVQYVIHVASPLPDRNSDLLIPAMQGTTSILESACKNPSIKKVVVTSSISSFMPLAGQPHGTVITGEKVLLWFPMADIY